MNEQNRTTMSNGSSSATSRSLLERVRADESDAWERLMSLYSPLVAHWCRRWGVPDQDVADIVQDSFQAVVRNFSSFRKARSGDTFRGWLRAIARNKVHDYFRRRGREPVGAGGSEAQMQLTQVPDGLDEDSDRSLDQEAEQSLFHRALELIRGDFEERTWRAFWRTAVDGQTPGDLCTELSMSPGAIRVAKSRVLQRLREELGDLTE